VDYLEKEIAFMKRIKLVLGLVAVMMAMMVALAAPAMAKDNDRRDNDFELDDGVFLVSDIDAYPYWYYYPYWVSGVEFDVDGVEFDSDGNFVNVDRDIDFANVNGHHNRNAEGNGGGGKKGNGR
jgi:hypothetical protein